MEIQNIVPTVNAFRSVRLFLNLLVLVLFVLSGVIFAIFHIQLELQREAKFKAQWGREWVAQYEKQIGSLSEARVKMAAEIVAIFVEGFILNKLRKVIRPGYRSRSAKRKESSAADSFTLPREKNLRQRRKAGQCLAFGVAGMIGGLFFLLGQSYFANRHYDFVIGAISFVVAYIGFTTGCFWWLKAKGWPIEVMSIAFAPLAVFLIPWVRIIFRRSAFVLLPFLATAFMPLIMMGVIYTLPDKSGFASSRNRRRR